MSKFVMTEQLSVELEGLQSMVSRYWGHDIETIEKVVVAAKAMLEHSDWKRRADIRDSKKLNCYSNGHIVNIVKDDNCPVCSVKL